MSMVQSYGHRVENMNGSVKVTVLCMYTSLLMYCFEFDCESQPVKVRKYC